MTTIKDLLRDFQAETVELCEENRQKNASDILVLEESLEQLVDEYAETIKERIVG